MYSSSKQMESGSPQVNSIYQEVQIIKKIMFTYIHASGIE